MWLAFAIHTAVVLSAIFLASHLPKHNPASFLNHSFSLPHPIVDNFIRWDAHWYTAIAEHGYNAKTLVFFPTTVVAIKLLPLFGCGYKVAGFFICNIFAFFSFSLLYLTFRLDYSESIAQRALLAYAVMPVSFFINSVYSEPLFIVFSVGCIYLTRIGRWRYAGIAAALATLTRNIGILLFLFMVYEWWQANRMSAKKWSNCIPAFFAPLALCGFMVYNFWLTGNPITFIRSQHYWGRQFGWPWESIWRNIQMIIASTPFPQPGTILDMLTVSITLVGLTLQTFSAAHRIRPSYLLIGWLWFLVPMFSTSPVYPLYSMSRFVLVVFPIYLFIGGIPIAYRYFTAISCLVLCLCTALFINWFWLG